MRSLQVMFFMVVIGLPQIVFAHQKHSDKKYVHVVAQNNNDFLVASAEINSWINTGKMYPQLTKIRQHAWDIWAAITAPSGEFFIQKAGLLSLRKEIPIWDTWYSRHEVFQSSNKQLPDYRPLYSGVEGPRQLQHEIHRNRFNLSATRYNPAAAKHVLKNRYYDPQVLTHLNQTLPQKPIKGRTIIPFPRDAIVVKPVHYMIASDQLSVVPYWSGTENTTFPQQPEPDTWKKVVIVDPSGALVGQYRTILIQRWTGKYQPEGSTQKEYITIKTQAEIVGLDQFYWHVIGPVEYKEIMQRQRNHLDLNDTADNHFSMDVLNSKGEVVTVPLKENSILLLVGMHVTTREIDQWTWQTFFWTRDKNLLQTFSADQSRTVHGVWSHFALRTSYYQGWPPNKKQTFNHVAYNPYVETQHGNLGTVSNCMTCHAGATWNNDGSNVPFLFYGYQNRNSARLKGSLQLDFLWSIQQGSADNLKRKS